MKIGEDHKNNSQQADQMSSVLIAQQDDCNHGFNICNAIYLAMKLLSICIQEQR
jgi:hypothetical protein